MKIFISHSSKNKDYGNALVDLLSSVGITSDNIIFTSNVAYGIPIGENIFDWLKNKISEKPHVLYLLSSEYYSSVACLNEMGAAWIVENKHTMIFTPNFDLKSVEFQNGALDPREIGFYINDQNRLTAFIESLKSSFPITTNPVLINQKIQEFIEKCKSVEKSVIKKTGKSKIDKKSQKSIGKLTTKDEIPKTQTDISFKKPLKVLKKNNGISKFFDYLINGKLNDEEILMINYIIDTGRHKLGTGWQESNEINNIEAWEDIHELNNTLSRNYAQVMRKFEMRKLIEASDFTSHGNIKEFSLNEEFIESVMNISNEILEKIAKIIVKNPKNGFFTF